MKVRSLRFAVFATLGLTACGGAEEQLQVRNDAIVNGSPATRPEHEAVVGLLIRVSASETRLCTGTLVTPIHVLTAAHCIDVGVSSSRPARPSRIRVFVGDSIASGQEFGVRRATLHPAWNRAAFTTDVAVLRLEEFVTFVTPVANLPADLGLRAADFGSSIDLVGFGRTETGDAGTKLRFKSRIAAFGCSLRGCPDLGSRATVFSYSLQNGGTCFGDSGGPAILFRNGTPYVAGLTSFGDTNCAQAGGSARVAPVDDWIRENTGRGSGGGSGDECVASQFDPGSQRTLAISCQGSSCTCTANFSVVGTCSTSNASAECEPFAGCCDQFF